MLVAAVFCCAAASVSCKKDSNDTNVAAMIMGKWIAADCDGQPFETNEKVVLHFVSTTKAYMSASFSHNPAAGEPWIHQEEEKVVIAGNKVSLSNNSDAHTTVENVFDEIDINDKEFSANMRFTLMVDGKIVLAKHYKVRFLRVETDYVESIIGTWQGRCTSESSAFDDGQEHRWEYLSDGTFVYYVKDGDKWVPVQDTLSEYFVAGNLLCSRWGSGGQENREWWEVAINGSKMNWTALRKNKDGSTFTVTFEMNRVLQ